MPLKMEFARACNANKNLTERFPAPGPGDRCKLTNPDQEWCQTQVTIFGFRGDVSPFSVQLNGMPLKMEFARACNVNKNLTERFPAPGPEDRCKLVNPDQRWDYPSNPAHQIHQKVHNKLLMDLMDRRSLFF